MAYDIEGEIGRKSVAREIDLDNVEGKHLGGKVLGS